MTAINIIGGTFNFLLPLLFCAVCISLIVRHVKDVRAAEKSVKAVVIDKYKCKKVSKYPQSVLGNEKCVIVFLTEGKKISFNVSEFSYAGYRINEKGVLKYKGSKLIDFT